MSDLDLAARLEVEDALEAAYAPLRSGRTGLSPLRVRAAVRWGRAAPPRPVRWVRAVSRLSELSVAAGMTVLVFVGAFGSAAVTPPDAPSAGEPARDESIYPVARVTAPLTDERWIRWLRLDRYVPLQDWLDPSVVRVGPAPRLQLPEPIGSPTAAGPF